MKKKHILLVDDNNLLCRGLSYHLTVANYEVSQANSAEEALEILKNTFIDLIILDIVLTGIDGLEALRRIRQGRQIKEFQTLAEAMDFLARRLQNLEHYRQQLLVNLVHELGCSLGALRTADLALIRGAIKDPQFSMELALGMEDEINSLQRLLEDLSHLHQQAVLGILELERQPVQISDWLGKISSAWQETAREKGIQWETDIPGNLPEIEADPVRLSQAVGNLLSNAVKFTPKGGSVFISAGPKMQLYG